MTVLYAILASYVSATIAMGVLFVAYRSKGAQKYLISDDPHRSKSNLELHLRVALNSTVSIVLIFSVMYGLADYLHY